jgi:peptidoglycan/LPS O-acetylase OafA/YrhL
MVAAVVLIPSGVKEAKFDPFQILSSYTFFPYARYDGRIAPILSLGWTLNYEVFFYALFAAAMAIGGRRAAWICIGALTLLVGLGALMPASAPAAFVFWTHNIVAEFALGILIALAHARWGRLGIASVPIAAATFSAGFILLYVLNLPIKPFDLPRAVTAGLPSALMMCAAVLLLPAATESRVPRWLIALGDSSYSLYLSHRFIQRPIQIVMTKTGMTSGALYVVAAVLAALAFAWVVYLLVERPLLRYFRSSTGSAGAVPDHHGARVGS